MQLITCFGQLASGKDEFCNYLVTKLPGWKRTSFAKAVKDIFNDAFSVDNDFIEEWKRKPEVPPGFLKPVRQSLQFIGDGFRQIKAEIWVERAFRDADRSIISDGRYFNEGIRTRERGGINVLLWRPGFENDDPNPSESQLRPVVDWYTSIYKSQKLEGFIWPKVDAPSYLPEAKLFDLFLVNDGTIDDLFNKIDSLIVPFIQNYYGDDLMREINQVLAEAAYEEMIQTPLN